VHIARRLAKIKGREPTITAPPHQLRVGPLRNPFFTALPVPAHLRESADVYRLGHYLVGATTGWNLIRQSTRDKATGNRTTTYFLHTFDASGNPTDFQRLPVEVGTGIVTNGDQLMTNDRWLGMAGIMRDPVTRKADDVWLVFDRSREPWPWRAHKTASTRGFMRGAALVGDHLIYAFVHNPTGPNSGGPEDYETMGDPTFGVVDIDLVTGQETLLASSRRQPGVTPVESEQIGPYTHIQQVSPNRVRIHGRRNASKHVYDTISGEWTAYDAVSKPASAKPSPPP